MNFKEIKRFFHNLKEQSMVDGCYKCPLYSTCPAEYPVCDSVINANPVGKPEPEDPRQLNLFNQ